MEAINYGIIRQKRHRPLPSPALKWLQIHFKESGFNGRFQIGYRKPESSALLPLTTQPLDRLHEFCEKAHFSSRFDYYITANSFSGVKRQKEDLFSLHNIVIDIDEHVNSPDEDTSGQDPDTETESLFYSNRPKLESFLHVLKKDVLSDASDLPSPTSVVFTGRGLQLWWAIVPMSSKCLTWYEEIRNSMILRMNDLLEEYPDDLDGLTVDAAASRNVVGYYRLPGSVNTKAGVVAAPEIWSGEQYDTHDLIKWAKAYQKTREQPSPTPLQLPDVDPFNYTDVEVRILKNVFTLAFFRIRQIIRLRQIRNDEIGEETRNNMCFMVYNTLLPAYGEEKAWEKVVDFNSGFKNPMTEKELHQSLDTATKKGGYHYKNETIISFLNITPEEQEQIEIFSSNEYTIMPRLSSHPSRTAARKLAKETRNKRIQQLFMEGMQRQEIADKLGISPNTVTSVLGARTPQREKARELKVSGATNEEIAAALCVSLRTIERYLSKNRIEDTNAFISTDEKSKTEVQIVSQDDWTSDISAIPSGIESHKCSKYEAPTNS